MVLSKITLFQFFHKDHTTNRNRVDQGTAHLCPPVLKQFICNQISKILVKELTSEGGTSNFLQNSQAIPQSRRRCTMVSSWHLHTGQTLSQFIPLDTKTSLTGMLPCMHNQRKLVILGKISNFHIHYP